jgi:hypothetical protein
MKKIHHSKAMSLWYIAEKATSSAICDCINSQNHLEKEKFTNKMWNKEKQRFCRKLNKYINELVKRNL